MIAIASAVAFTPRVRASAGSNGRVARAIAPQKIRIGATERRTSVVAASGGGTNLASETGTGNSNTASGS